MTKKKYFLLNIGAMAAVAVLLIVGLALSLDMYTRHGEGVDVPTVKGMLFTDARHLLEQHGLMIEVTDSGFNKTLPPDCILEQSPGKGARVKQGHVIYVTVNSPSSPTLAIPDIIDNCSLREATAKLTAMGFKLLEPEKIHGEKDWVLGIKSRGRNLSAGDRVSIDIPLMLMIGDGKYDDDDDISQSDDQRYDQPDVLYSSESDYDDFEEVP